MLLQEESLRPLSEIAAVAPLPRNDGIFLHDHNSWISCKSGSSLPVATGLFK